MRCARPAGQSQRIALPGKRGAGVGVAGQHLAGIDQCLLAVQHMRGAGHDIADAALDRIAVAHRPGGATVEGSRGNSLGDSEGVARR